MCQSKILFAYSVKRRHESIAIYIICTSFKPTTEFMDNFEHVKNLLLSNKQNMQFKKILTFKHIIIQT